MFFFKDAVHFLEPMGRESRDMHIFGDGLKTLLRRSVYSIAHKKVIISNGFNHGELEQHTVVLGLTRENFLFGCTSKKV